MAAAKTEVNLSDEALSKIDEIITSEIKNVTLDTISLENLGSDLLESDVDKYLALKDETPSNMSKSYKYKKVADFLAEQVDKKGRKAAVDKHFLQMAVDKHFLQMAKEARLITERAAKETEIHTAVRQATSPYRSKDKTTKLRKDITNLDGYKNKDTQDKLQASRKETKARKAKKRRVSLAERTKKLVDKAKPELQDAAFYTEILESLEPFMDEVKRIAKEAKAKAKEEQDRLEADKEEREKAKNSQPQSVPVPVNDI